MNATPVLIFDEWPDQTRSWKKVVPTATLLPDTLSDEDIIKRIPLGRCIAIAHRTPLVSRDHGVEGTLSSWTKERPDLHIVVITAVARTDKSIHPRIYFRRAPVSENTDLAFGERFDRFRRAFDKGEEDFRLLEPDELPQHLLCAYLVTLAASSVQCGLAEDRDEFVRKALSKEIWSKARGEFLERLQNNMTASTQLIAAEEWPEVLCMKGVPIDGVLLALRTAIAGRRGSKDGG